MQENTESEKPEEPEIPEDQKEVSDEDETAESVDSSEASFEEQEVEVLPPEKKKGNGCGLFLFFLLLLGAGGGYLFYTDQVPPQIKQWVKPYYESAHQKLFGASTQDQAKVQFKPVPVPPEKWTSQVEEPDQTPAIQENFPVVEQKVEAVPTPSTPEPTPIEEHISGTQTDPISAIEEVDPNYPAKISGNATTIESESHPLREEPNVAIVRKEPVELNQPEEKLVEPVPEVKAPPFLYIEEPSEDLTEEPSQQAERGEAVQAYLDFIESTLGKIGDLIKTGFSKGKDYLMKSWN